jgi:hypothetical protein
MQIRSIAVFIFALASSACWADELPIGYVKTVSGDASVTTGKSRIAAQLGTPLFMGSHLQTGHKSTLGVTFKDDTVMSFGPDTELTVDEYLYAPNQGKLKLAASITKGSLNYVSGVIAKLQPDAVSVSTPTGTIGVRGTQFVVSVEGGAP